MGTMDERMNEAWTDVADGFSALGAAMKDKLHPDPDEPEPTRELVAAGDALGDALNRLVVAASEVGQRTVGIVRDEDVRNRVKEVATSLTEALSATVDLVGREVAAMFRRPDPTPTSTGEAELPPKPEIPPARPDETADGPADEPPEET
jgi:hypothetical protein